MCTVMTTVCAVLTKVTVCPCRKYGWLCSLGLPPPPSPGATAQRGPCHPHSRGFWITHNNAPQSVGLLWTSDQLVAESSTKQHTTLTTEKHPCPRLDSNPQSQQASGRMPSPLGPTCYPVY